MIVGVAEFTSGAAIPARVIAEFSSGGRLGEPVRTRDGWLVAVHGSPELIEVDDALLERGRVRFDAGVEQWLGCAVAPDGAIAVAADAEVLLTEADGTVRHRWTHPAWQFHTGGSVSFDEAGRLWFAVPGEPAGQADTVRVVDPGTGGTVASLPTPNDEGMFAIAQAGPGRTIAEVACGQDGAYGYLVTEGPAGFELTGLPDAGVAGVDADTCFLFDLDGEWLARYGLVRHAELARIASGELELPAWEWEGFGYQALPLDADTVVATTLRGRLVLLDAGTLELIGTIWPDGYDLTADEDDPTGDLTAIAVAPGGRLLIVRDQRRLQLLELAEEPIASSAT
ncbi:MAG: hypothetical protein HZY73_03920 [Micropruina sp.]|nr:MAG: hypothetical protein HZY73_03920 [Micropruina sp.]